MVKKLEGAGLRGQVAGETSLSTVGQIEGWRTEVTRLKPLQKKPLLKKLHTYFYIINYLIPLSFLIINLF